VDFLNAAFCKRLLPGVKVSRLSMMGVTTRIMGCQITLNG
jgi:hypothetical protein